jgi:hypothetical protein
MTARIHSRAGFLSVALGTALCLCAFRLSAQTLIATRVREDTITKVGLTVEHYSKLLNGQAYQQNAIMTYNGYQYAVYWNSSRHVCIYRRNVSTNVAQTLELTDYANTLDDSHNNIMMGICPVDGTIHLSFDHHDTLLNYRKSVDSLALKPASFPWVAANFNAVQHQFNGTSIHMVTYPRFINAPSGRMLFECRIGQSGYGDAYLWEYDGSTKVWTTLGKYINGISSNVNPYLFGINYAKNGRLHVTWCWRATPDASTNQDLYYAYSDDNGRTWRNNAGTQVGTTGTVPMTMAMTSCKVWTIAQNRGYINQESQSIDSKGRVHVLTSYLPDASADYTNFDSARVRVVSYQFYRDTAGVWHRNPLNVLTKINRGQIAFDSLDNAYAALYNVRLLGATARSGWTDWHMLDSAQNNRFYSEVLMDKEGLLSRNMLSYVNPARTTGSIYILTYALSGQTGVIERKSVSVIPSTPLRFTRHGDLLHFTDAASDAPYAICTVDGAVVNRGRGKSIDISHLNAGCFLVRIGGVTLKVVK